MTDESVLTMPVWQLYSWTVYANLAGIISIMPCYRCDGTLSLDLSSVWLHWESYWFYLIYLAFDAFRSLFISISLYVGQVICWLAYASTYRHMSICQYVGILCQYVVRFRYVVVCQYVVRLCQYVNMSWDSDISTYLHTLMGSRISLYRLLSTASPVSSV